MPEETKRTCKQIEQEYQNLTFKSGALQYELACKTKDLDLINETLRGLASEFAEVKKAEDAEAAASAPQEQTQ